jgi:hypothetical protein
VLLDGAARYVQPLGDNWHRVTDYVSVYSKAVLGAAVLGAAVLGAAVLAALGFAAARLVRLVSGGRGKRRGG